MLLGLRHVLPAIVLLASCAQPVTLKTIPSNTTFNTAPENANVFLYRDEDFSGSLPLILSMNNSTIGTTTGRTYFRLELPPNVYTFSTALATEPPLVLGLDAGKTYFIRQEVKSGMTRAYATLEVVDPNRGQDGVNASSPLEVNEKFQLPTH